MRKAIAALLMTFTALAGFPQQTFVETIEVRVANIDVVVRDRAGNPINGLTRDDFELTVDGVKEPITNFYEVRRGEDTSPAQSIDAQNDVPLEVRQRRVVVFVDCASLMPSRKAEALASVRKFIETRLRPEDQAMLVAWRLRLDVVTPFTTSKEALKRGLDVIAHEGPAGESSQQAIASLMHNIEDLADMAEREQGQTRALVTWAQAYDQSRVMVERYSHLLLTQQEQMIDALRRVDENIAGLEGKKVLVFVGEHFPEHPGAELFRYINDVFSPHLDRNSVLEFEPTNGIPGDTMPNVIAQLAKDASATGVTIYAIGAASAANAISSEKENSVVPPDYGYDFTRDANTSSALERMADITGGVAITRTSNFDLAFETINRDLSSYYSIGYKPAGEGFQQHKVIVRAKNRAYSVRSRQTLVVKSTDDQMTDRAIANLYTDGAASAWPIAVRTGQPKREGRKFMIPVQVVMAPTLTLLPQNQKLSGGFVLYFVVGTADGRTSDVMRRPENLNIPASAEAAVRAKPMTFTTAIRVNPGESVLSVAIFDQLSGTTGFARAKIVAR